MQEASNAVFSGHSFCYLGVHTVIGVSTQARLRSSFELFLFLERGKNGHIEED